MRPRYLVALHTGTLHPFDDMEQCCEFVQYWAALFGIDRVQVFGCRELDIDTFLA